MPPKANMPPKAKPKAKKKAPPPKKQLGVGAFCNILVKTLHPQIMIDSIIPKSSRINKQHLNDCVVVSRETKNIKKEARIVIVVRHELFGDKLIFCAERFAKVTVEGPADGFFKKKIDLPIIANGLDYSKPPIDLNRLDKLGGSSLSEDIALARSQGIEVDDDNEPAPENIPPAGSVLDATTNKFGQTWGWNGTCNRKSNHHVDVSPQIKDHTISTLKQTSYLDMFLLFFPLAYLEDVLVAETSRTLVSQAHSPLTTGEFIRFIGCIFFMSCFSGADRNDFFSSDPITMAAGAPYRLTQFMAGYRFQQIKSCLTLTTRRPDQNDRFWEIRDLMAAWNKNMQEIYIPGWVSCLDESMSIWNNRFTCPGYCYVPRKPHPQGNEYHTIADGVTTILYAAEIRMGDKHTPVGYVHEFEKEEGKTSSLIARLTRSIWHSGKVLILDSGFCVLKALTNLKKRGLFAGAVIKKRRYWPTMIQGKSHRYDVVLICYCYMILIHDIDI